MRNKVRKMEAKWLHSDIIVATDSLTCAGILHAAEILLKILSIRSQ